MSDETVRADAKEALAAVRDGARRAPTPASGAARSSEPAFPAPVPPSAASPTPPIQPPAPPDLAAVESAARAVQEPRGLLGGLVADAVAQQSRFNAEQLRFDAATIRYIHERLDATHAHYDGLMQAQQRRMDEIDERHRQLQAELIRHVHALSRRVDLATAEAAAGRMGLDFLLRELKERVDALEERLRRA